MVNNSGDEGSSVSNPEPPNQEVLALRAQLASLRAVIERAGILPEGFDSDTPANPVPLGPPRTKGGPGVVVATQPGVAGGRAASEIPSRPESRALTDSNRFSEKRAGEALASRVNVGAPTTDEGGGERRLKDKYVSTAARAGPRTRLVNDSATVQRAPGPSANHPDKSLRGADGGAMRRGRPTTARSGIPIGGGGQTP